MFGAECTGEVTKHNSHSARLLVKVSVYTAQQEDDGVLNSKSGLVGKLLGIQVWLEQRLELLEDKFLQGLHDVGGQCHRQVAPASCIVGTEQCRMFSTSQGPFVCGGSC